MAPNSATKAIIRVAIIKGDGKVPFLTRIKSPFVALSLATEIIEYSPGVTIVLKFPLTGESSTKHGAATNASMSKVNTAFFMRFTVFIGFVLWLKAFLSTFLD